ncbi:hypothetical protein [Psychromicrobium sp. YIM B11713]|uniref:hypothetical protein n=1 Tax=Psychromicrobium sp. YIM B11713 TaxID=3145233 RepID=UPI00374ED78E
MKRLITALATVAALGALGLSAAPVQASETKNDPLSQLAKIGLYNPSGSATGLKERVAKQPQSASAAVINEGLKVAGPNTSSALTMKPVGDLKASSADGALVFKSSANYSYVLTDATSGATAGYSIIGSKDSPTEYSYEINVGGKPAKLSATQSGSILVSDHGGKANNLIAPAWAKDATGKALKTTYSVSNNVVTQKIDFSNAQFPVIADPRLQKDWLNNTVEFTRGETATAADSAGGFALICGGAVALLPVAAACGVLAGASVVVANNARNQGKCLGIRWGNGFPIPGAPYPVIVDCYA